MTENEALKVWKEESLDLKSDGTAKVYIKHLNKFLGHRNITADEMAKWDKEKATHELMKYMGWLKKEGIASKTMAIAWHTLRNFFRTNGVKIDERIPFHIKRKYRDIIPTKEQLRQILDHSPLQVKLGISLMAFSGLSPSDVVKRKYGNFKDDLEADVSPVMLTIRRQKTGNEFVTFVPDQTIRYLKEWLDYRRNKGEEINDNTPIFRWGSIDSMIQKQTQYIRKSGVKIRNGFRMRNYCFRKYFRRGLLGKIDENLAEFFMGHTIDLPGIYSGLVDLDPESIKKAREEYGKALPDLITEGDISIRDFNDLKERMEQLEEENSNLKERLNGFQLALTSLSNGDINQIAEVLARALENRNKKE